jgi:hypothetical protein
MPRSPMIGKSRRGRVGEAIDLVVVGLPRRGRGRRAAASG